MPALRLGLFRHRFPPALRPSTSRIGYVAGPHRSPPRVQFADISRWTRIVPDASGGSPQWLGPPTTSSRAAREALVAEEPRTGSAGSPWRGRTRLRQSHRSPWTESPGRFGRRRPQPCDSACAAYSTVSQRPSRTQRCGLQGIERRSPEEKREAPISHVRLNVPVHSGSAPLATRRPPWPPLEPASHRIIKAGNRAKPW